jgi:hypothetical protein
VTKRYLIYYHKEGNYFGYGHDDPHVPIEKAHKMSAKGVEVFYASFDKKTTEETIAVEITMDSEGIWRKVNNGKLE